MVPIFEKGNKMELNNYRPVSFKKYLLKINYSVRNYMVFTKVINCSAVTRILEVWTNDLERAN